MACGNISLFFFLTESNIQNFIPHNYSYNTLIKFNFIMLFSMFYFITFIFFNVFFIADSLTCTESGVLLSNSEIFLFVKVYNYSLYI